nr:hypothetical protein [Tanacetum cinerariifolium]
MTKLIVVNEHLKQTYKQLYDSIKPSLVQDKEYVESLVNQLNQKSVEIIDLNAQLQEKVFVITTLKNDLRKFKGKDIVDNVAQASNATTISPGMYKLDPVTLAPRDKNNRETHIYYLKHTMEQVDILREIVEQAKLLNPLNIASYSACKHEICFLEFVSYMNASSKSKSVKKAKKKEEWKPTGKVFTKIRYNWRPTGRTITLDRNACPLTRITATNKVPLREPIPLKVVAQESVVTKVYTKRSKVVQVVLWYLDSGCSKHITRDRSQLTNFVHKFLDTVKFGLRKLKFEKDHLCLACAMGKSQKQSHKPKSEDTNQEKLYLLDMDLCGPIHVASVNGKKYILVVVDDYSRFIWVKFLASKDEALDFIIKFLKMIQVRLNATVRNIRTYNGTEFVNQTLQDYYEQAVVTACYTQNQSIIRRSHRKTPYELFHDRKPYLSYFHVFGALCYPNNDSENLGKFQAKADIVLVANAPRAVDLADSHVSTSIDQDAPNKVLKNKATLVAQGFRQEEGIDFEESFALAPRIEAICFRLVI